MSHVTPPEMGGVTSPDVGRGQSPDANRGRPPATTPGDGASVVRKLGTAVAVVLIGGGVLTQTATAMQHTDRETRVLPSSVKRLVLEGGSGDVSVQESATSQAEARPDARWSWQEPVVDITTTADGTQSHITSSCSGWNPFLTCSVSWSLTVPAGTDLVIQTSSGDIDLASMSGTAQLSTKSGDITVKGSQAVDLRLATSSGDVEVRNARTPKVSVETTSGDITIDSLVTLNGLDARATSGDVTVRVPRESAPYAVEQNTRSGTTRSVVSEDPSSPRWLRLESTSGDLTVDYR